MYYLHTQEVFIYTYICIILSGGNVRLPRNKTMSPRGSKGFSQGLQTHWTQPPRRGPFVFYTTLSLS